MKKFFLILFAAIMYSIGYISLFLNLKMFFTRHDYDWKLDLIILTIIGSLLILLPALLWWHNYLKKIFESKY